MSSFYQKFPNFKIDNIAFSVEKFTGLQKYPISLWNLANSQARHFYLRHSSDAIKSDSS